MGIKIEKSKKVINLFGGINFVIDKIKDSGLPCFIDNLLGVRPPQAEYRYSDIVLGNSYANLCGGTCLNDIDVLKESWGNIPGLKISSSHNTSTVLRSLATETETIVSNTGVKHEFNKNPLLNNDFNWSNMPFSFLNKNTVFMQLTALTNIIYKYLANWAASKVDWFKSNFRLKKFILRFITVASRWKYRGRSWKLVLYTAQNYEAFNTS